VADVVLYALSATNLTILVALTFVLARNIVKLVVERRKALPFARFRFKLVTVLLGMTLIPAVLVLIIGSELIRNNVDRWFNATSMECCRRRTALRVTTTRSSSDSSSSQAQRSARSLRSVDLEAANSSAIRDLVAPDVLQERVDLVEVYRVSTSPEPRTPLVPRPRSSPRRRFLASIRARRRTVWPSEGGREWQRGATVEQSSGGGDLIRTAMPIRSSPSAPVRGVVVASEYLTDQFAARARGMTAAYESYQQLRVLKQPLAGVYLSFFLMLTLMILVGSTWMGLYSRETHHTARADARHRRRRDSGQDAGPSRDR
jgi:two-component system nitrogen regulation sensor histidine kinase NtrY